MDDLLSKIGFGAVVFVAGVIITLIVMFIIKLKSSKTVTEVHKVNSVVIQQSLQDMGFLITEEYMCTSFEDSERKKDLFGKAMPLTMKRVIFTCDVTIIAGVDFEKVKVDFDNFHKKIIVTIPNAVIYGEPALDLDSLHNVLEKKAVFAKRDGIDDYKDMLSDMKEHALESANKMGLITKANKTAETMIKNFVLGILLSTEEFVDYEILVQFNGEEVVENK